MPNPLAPLRRLLYGEQPEDIDTGEAALRPKLQQQAAKKRQQRIPRVVHPTIDRLWGKIHKSLPRYNQTATPQPGNWNEVWEKFRGVGVGGYAPDIFMEQLMGTEPTVTDNNFYINPYLLAIENDRDLASTLAHESEHIGQRYTTDNAADKVLQYLKLAYEDRPSEQQAFARGHEIQRKVPMPQGRYPLEYMSLSNLLGVPDEMRRGRR